jgi:hypothetical protein
MSSRVNQMAGQQLCIADLRCTRYRLLMQRVRGVTKQSEVCHCIVSTIGGSVPRGRLRVILNTPINRGLGQANVFTRHFLVKMLNRNSVPMRVRNASPTFKYHSPPRRQLGEVLPCVILQMKQWPASSNSCADC